MVRETVAHTRPKPVHTSDNSQAVEFTYDDLRKLEHIFEFWRGLNSMFNEVGFSVLAAPTLERLTNPATESFERFFKDLEARFPKEGE